MLIYPITFFISLLMGIIVAYVMLPPPKVIIKNPDLTKNMSDDTIYLDDNEVCYKYYKEYI